MALGALGLAFLVSLRWGHHVGRVLGHPEDEQLLLRILGLTLITAAVAEHLHASAAVGAFLVGLTLTGPTADRARTVLSPLRDLFAAVFFVAIGLTVNPADLLPMLPFALALAAITAVTKVITGAYAARREARPGVVNAGRAPRSSRAGILAGDHWSGRNQRAGTGVRSRPLRLHPGDRRTDTDSLCQVVASGPWHYSRYADRFSTVRSTSV